MHGIVLEGVDKMFALGRLRSRSAQLFIRDAASGLQGNAMGQTIVPALILSVLAPATRMATKDLACTGESCRVGPGFIQALLEQPFVATHGLEVN